MYGRNRYALREVSFELFHQFSPLVFQLIELKFEPFQFFHLLQQSRLFWTDVQFDDLYLWGKVFIPLLSSFKLLLLDLQLLFLFLILLLPGFEFFLLLFDLLLLFVELLQIIDFHLYIGLVYNDDLFVKIFNFFLELFDLVIHLLDILFPLPEIIFSLVFLLLQMLLQKAKVTSPFLVYFFATTLPTYRWGAETTKYGLVYQWWRFTPLCWLKGCLQMLQIYAFANYYCPFNFRPGTLSISGADWEETYFVECVQLSL